MKNTKKQVKNQNTLKPTAPFTISQQQLEAMIGKITRVPKIMSECAKLYQQALYDPKSCKTNPCIPSLVALPSNKIRVEARGTFYSNTLGNAGVWVHPWRLLTNDLVVGGDRTSPAITYSKATGTTAVWSTVSNPLTESIDCAYATGNSPYLSGNLGFGAESGRSAKLVACGLYVAYRGPKIQQGGSQALWRNTADFNRLKSELSDYSGVLKLQGTTETPTSSKWNAVTYFPSDEGDIDAIQDPMEGTQMESEPCSNLACGVFISGQDPEKPVPFEYHVVAFFELYGMGMPLTESHSDVGALGAVISSLPTSGTNPDAQVAYALGKVSTVLKDLSNGGTGWGNLGGKTVAGTLMAKSPFKTFGGPHTVMDPAGAALGVIEGAKYVMPFLGI